MSTGKNEVRAIFVGDILIRNTGPVFAALKKHNFDGEKVFGEFFTMFSDAELFTANYEGVFIEDPHTGTDSTNSVFFMQTDPVALKIFERISAKKFLSFANNHSVDFGVQALEKTRQLLSMKDIMTLGLGTYEDMMKATRITSGDISISLLAFTDLLAFDAYSAPGRFGVFKLTDSTLADAIPAARSGSDVVIVQLHTVQNFNAPFSEQPDSHQRRMAELAIELGADIVIGHHPHGLQRIQKYKGKYIFHSIGSFLYNPLAGSLFGRGHTFHHSTQFYGGALIDCKISKKGITDIEITATQNVYKDNCIYVVQAPDSMQEKAQEFLSSA